MLAGAVEEHLRAEHVRAHEDLRVEDRTVHVGLGREVHHRVDGVFGEHALHRLGVRDVGPHEVIARVVLDVGEILQVAGVGEQVDVHDLGVGPLAQQVTHEVGAAETGPAGDEALLHVVASADASPARRASR